MHIFKRRGHESTGHLEKSIRDFIELRIWKNAKAYSWTARSLSEKYSLGSFMQLME